MLLRFFLSLEEEWRLEYCIPQGVLTLSAPPVDLLDPLGGFANPTAAPIK